MSFIHKIDAMKKVLIVENQKPLLEQEKSILSNRDLKIFTAASGEEAVAIHKTERVNLIITGLDMLGMRGDALCSAFRKDGDMKNVSVLIVCAGSRSDFERCQSCGANSYITKPLDPVKFLEKVGALIDVPKRTGIRVLIRVSVMGSINSESFFCTSVNISTSGILLECEKIIPKGAIVNCSFFVPGSERITVDCEVMRVTSVPPDLHHYGVKFLNLHQDHRTAVEAFVRRKTT